MKVVLYNDCFIPGTQHHFGCELVKETFKAHFYRVDIDLIGSVTKENVRLNEVDHDLLSKADLVVVNGEGSLHHNRRNDLIEIAAKYPAVLVNSVWENNIVDGLENFKYISVRESASYDAMLADSGIRPELVPDIIFSNIRLLGLTGQQDSGKQLKVGHIRHFSGIRTMQSADKFLRELKTCTSVTSESFHGIIAAKMAGIPIDRILDSNTHKNTALMRDITNTSSYIPWAVNTINKMFENLHNL